MGIKNKYILFMAACQKFSGNIYFTVACIYAVHTDLLNSFASNIFSLWMKKFFAFIQRVACEFYILYLRITFPHALRNKSL